MNRTMAIVVVALTLLGAAGCCCCGDVNWEEFFRLFTPTPEATPVITREPAGDVGAETEQLLETTDVPIRDLYALAVRLQGLPLDTPFTINPGGSPDYPVGSRRLFHASNLDTDEQFDLYATLVYKTEHVYMWVEDGVRFDQDDAAAAAELFEKHTYSTNREFFGSEWTPGIDNDPHLSILNARNLGYNTLGYFSGPDEFVSAVRPDSNEMEIFYISMDNATINSDEYNSVLAHEFQHMIHWYNDRNEDTWLNEGFSELATQINGFDPGGHEWSFAINPDNQLNDIDYDAPDSSASYGSAYLFTAYFLDRFGPQATQALVAHPENGLASFDKVLAGLGGMNHVDLFADWIVTNIVNDCSVADGRYCYREIDAPFFSADLSYSTGDYPVSASSTVHQYGTDYVEVSGGRPLAFRFTGSTQIGLVDTAAHSGRYLWWSNRGDDSDMTLTRAFDLSGVSNATLEYWAWYDIEEDWDYAYVEVSTDGGQTWTILRTPSGTGTNPNGNSYGWGYTGASGGGNRGGEWIREQVDLSPYAGQQVLVRFEYITDEAVNKPGFAVDDIAIPEIGYASDFEAGDDGWEAAGFIRHANVLPQRWLLQLILFGDETTVQRLELNDDRTGEWTIPLGGSARRAIVTISAFAPVTTEEASYSYEIWEQ